MSTSSQQISMFADLQEFLRNIRKYTDPTELTAEMLNDLVEKL